MQKNVTDREFNIIRNFVENRSEAELIMFICENYNNWVKDIPEDIAKYIINFHKRFQFWGNFDPEKVKERNFRSYFDMDLISVSGEEIFVDLGAWKGDTLDDYIQTYGSITFKKYMLMKLSRII